MSLVPFTGSGIPDAKALAVQVAMQRMAAAPEDSAIGMSVAGMMFAETRERFNNARISGTDRTVSAVDRLLEKGWSRDDSVVADLLASNQASINIGLKVESALADQFDR